MSVRPGFYWARNGNWEIIFVRMDQLVDARGAVQDRDTSNLYLSCELKGLQPPGDLATYHAWADAEGRREPVPVPIATDTELIEAAKLALEIFNELEESIGGSFDTLHWGAHKAAKDALVKALEGKL